MFNPTEPSFDHLQMQDQLALQDAAFNETITQCERYQFEFVKVLEQNEALQKEQDENQKLLVATQSEFKAKLEKSNIAKEQVGGIRKDSELLAKTISLIDKKQQEEQEKMTANVAIMEQKLQEFYSTYNNPTVQQAIDEVNVTLEVTYDRQRVLQDLRREIIERFVEKLQGSGVEPLCEELERMELNTPADDFLRLILQKEKNIAFLRSEIDKK